MQWIKKHKRLTGTVAAASLFFLLFLVLRSFGGDAQLAKVQELKKQLSGEQAKKLAPAQRRELWNKLNDEVKQLSPEQRRTLAKEREQAMAGKLKNFFALSKAQPRSRYLPVEGKCADVDARKNAPADYRGLEIEYLDAVFHSRRE